MSQKKYKVKMLKSCNGSEDGFTDRLWRKGETYTINESLYKCFVDAGAVELVTKEEKKEEKAQGPAPKNKDLGKAPKNKAQKGPKKKKRKKTE